MKNLLRFFKSSAFFFSLCLLACCAYGSLVASTPAFAQVSVTNSSTSARPTITGDREALREATPSLTQSQRIESLQQKLLAEIDRRIKAFDALIILATPLKRLSSTQKTTLIEQLKTQKERLETLKVTVSSQTTLPALRTDLRTVRTSFNAYGLFVPKVHILAAAEKINDTTILMSSAAGELDMKVKEASASGKDTTSLQKSLDTLTTELKAAEKAATSAQTLVVPLTQVGYPRNKSTLQNAHGLLMTARKHLTTARQELATLSSALK